MRAKRSRSAEHLDSDRAAARRRKASRRSGIPKLGLWEVGVGAVWK
ncbi:hypothetical protein [Mycolicibacterium rutilum]|nr:hypothetical protein [Mycolicibacterium rutilum]